jgi:hypothetical protein
MRLAPSRAAWVATCTILAAIYSDGITVVAFFTGPDGCAEGGNAGGLADIIGAQQVPFAESGIEFTINGQAITQGSDILLEINGNYDFSLVASGGNPFVGGLIRVQQGVDASSFSFAPSDTRSEPDSEVAAACQAPAKGVTQIESISEKTTLTGRFVSSSLGTVSIEVTVVLTNSTQAGLTYSYAKFEVDTTTPENPVPTPTSIDTLEPTTTTIRPPTFSPAPTFVEVCDICASPDLSITLPDATLIINGVSATCRLISQIADARLVPPGQPCNDTIAAVVENCGCLPNEPSAPTMLPVDTLAPTTAAGIAPTISPAPTFQEECYICGSPDLSITMPDATVIINGVSATCGQISQIADDRLVPPGQACDDTIAAVIQSCGCSPNEPIIPTATPPPPTGSSSTLPPSSSPLPIAFTTAEPYTSPDNKPSDGGKGGKTGMGMSKKGSSKGGKGKGKKSGSKDGKGKGKKSGSKDGKGMGKSRSSSKGEKGKGKG